ncbi:hypothetical protein MMPV_007170 [Pyropia vietnamensis]
MAFMVLAPVPLRRPTPLASRGRAFPHAAVAAPLRMAKEIEPNATSDRILIRPTPATKATASGLLLATGSEERPTTGTVIAVGPGLTYTTGEGKEPMPVRIGDHVLWDQYDGLEVTVPGMSGKVISVRARNLAAYW